MNDDITKNLKKVVSEKSGCIKCYCICTIYRLINEHAHWYMLELPSNTDSTGYNILIIKIKQDYICMYEYFSSLTKVAFKELSTSLSFKLQMS